MKEKLINWLLKSLEPKLSENQRKQINDFKMAFKLFFEGYDGRDTQAYKTYVPIISFGITDLKFTFTETNKLNVTIVLQRPGLLIGKGGETITSLAGFMKKNHNVNKIDIEESKLWRKINK